MRRPFRFFDGKKGGTFFTKEGTVFPSESCPRGTNFTREFCPGGHYFQGDNLNCDTGNDSSDIHVFPHCGQLERPLSRCRCCKILAVITAKLRVVPQTPYSLLS